MNKLIVFALLLLSPGLRSQTLPYKDRSLPVEARVKDLLGRMTKEEKFWQLFMIPGQVDTTNEAQFKNGIFGFQFSAESSGSATAAQLLKYNTSETALSLLKKINNSQKYFVEKTRLGIPIIAFDEALHGIVREGGTAFPQAIGLAASFDPELVHEVASAIALEAKARGIRQILSPVVNIASDVRWGRVEETYGEDPLLSSEIGVAFVSAFEKQNIITTPKHFLANTGDGGRDSYPIHWNERLLEEIYLPPFKAVIKRGAARSIMTSYNSIDGAPASANDWLLNQKLKKEWGFNGFVISDAGAVGGANVLHFTTKDYPASGAASVNNGLDVIFQTNPEHHKLFDPHFLDGSMQQAVIDSAVARVLRAKFELGLFENPYVSESDAQRWLASAKHKEVAKKAALESIVLLKNEAASGRINAASGASNTTGGRSTSTGAGNNASQNNIASGAKNINSPILPLKKSVRSVAVIGTDATEARLGGYSGPGNDKVSILDGIRKKIGKTKVSYAPGPGIRSETSQTVPAEYLSHKSADGKILKGLEANFYDNIKLEGSPVITRINNEINFKWTFMPPDEKLRTDNYSVRWSGQLKAPATGNYKLGLEGNDGFRMYVNNKLVIDNWTKQSYHSSMVKYAFVKNQAYDIRVEFYEPVGNAAIRLVWNYGIPDNKEQLIREAVAAAVRSEVAVVVAGIHEGEFQDRAILELPGQQEELIRAVAATGKPVVVVLIGGSAITMNNWIDMVPGIVDAWYPGEEGGDAVADVLFGDYNPAGRLPVTFPISVSQVPLVYNHKPTGRGDDYYDLTGLPLFPFGYGLSYTGFEYEDIKLSKSTIASTDSVLVTCSITNIGKVAGEEVVQLYIRDELASLARPVMELKGFHRIALKPGEKKTVEFVIGRDQLMMLDKNCKEVVEPGDFRIMIGASSRDIRLKTTLTVQ